MKRNIILAISGIALVVMLSLGCKLEINDPVRSVPIVRPYISVQPQSAAYDITAETYEGVATLSIQVYDWVPEDGRLTYQWYTFTDMEQYLKTGATAIPGANDLSYTPEIADTSAGKAYYYYVEVTNYFGDAIGAKRAVVRSDVVAISFYDNTMAPLPVITRHPIDASYTIGRSAAAASLEVQASVIGEGTLTYQWYSSTKSTIDIEESTELEDQTNSSYLPDIGSLPKGDSYFFVVITNTVRVSNSERLTSTITCVPVKISMLPGDKVAKPKILIEPRDQFIKTSDEVLPLSVKAGSNDGGLITYQWYKSNKAGATANPVAVSENAINYVVVPVVPELIEGATGDEFTPVIDTANPGTTYYFAIATNTNNDVLGEKIATVQSKVVTVRVAPVGTGNENATITIRDTSVAANRYQYIRGYGGMDVAWANFPATSASDTETMYNPDWGLGFNILRIMIVPPGSSQGNYTTHEDIVYGRDKNRDDYNGWSGLIPNHRPDYLENVRVVNRHNGYVLASPWTPPKEWKTNNSINSGGELMPVNYRNFANYLRAFCQFMYLENAPVYAVSIANEPNYAGGYDGCEWKDGKGEPHMMNFFLAVGQFTQGVRGFGGGKATPRVLIVNGESANNPDINFPVLNNVTARNAVDFYARHVYGEQLATLWSNDFADWREGSPYQTECWMTEHNINSANALAFVNDSTWNYIWRFMNDVDLVIRMNNENAFVWWASKRFYSFIGDGQSGTRNGAMLPRGYGLSHFAKYSNDTTRIRFDMTGTLADRQTDIGLIDRPPAQGGKINTTNDFSLDSLDAKIVAFESPDKSEISLVMFTPTATNGDGGVDLGTIKINLPAGFGEIGSVKAQKSRRTVSGGNDVLHLMESYDDEVVISTDRKSAWVVLNRSEILSIRFTKKQ
jgi:O-glycosyl hydrolase